MVIGYLIVGLLAGLVAASWAFAAGSGLLLALITMSFTGSLTMLSVAFAVAALPRNKLVKGSFRTS
ncbi:MAG: hypothetical protein AAF871_15145 [Pseudomonadota bacterium]